MPKSSSSHASQIKFKSRDDVYHVNDPPPRPSGSNTKTEKTTSKNSKSSLKSGKSSPKEDSRSKSSKETLKSKSDKSPGQSRQSSASKLSNQSGNQDRGSPTKLPKQPKSQGRTASPTGSANQPENQSPATPSKQPNQPGSSGRATPSKASNQSGGSRGRPTSTPKPTKHEPPEELDESEIKPTKPPKQTLQVENAEYLPAPYIFRTPKEAGLKEVKGIPAKCPPYYLQLDHTLAVVWSLFSKEEIERPLGIVQLQWALNFLQGIYNRRGEHPKDVALCIQQIQDHLIEQYADMVDDIQYIKKPPKELPSPDMSKDKGKDKKSKSKSQASRSESEVPDVEHEEKELDENAGEDQTQEPEGEEGCDDDTCPNNICSDDCAGNKDEMIMRQIPFSINYADMITRTPPGVEELYPCCKSSKTSSITSSTRKSISAMGTSVSRENMMEFLKAWRREQVEKIQAELKRLKSIENFIGSADTENFSPYLDQKQLDALVNSSRPKPRDKSKLAN